MVEKVERRTENDNSSRMKLLIGICICMAIGWFLASICRAAADSDDIYDDASRKPFSDN